MAGGNFGTLAISLIAETAAFTSGLEKAATQLDATAGRMVRSVDGVSKGLETAVRAVEGFVAILAVDRIKEWGKGVVEAADNLNKLAATTGSTVESLSRLSNIAAVSGTPFDTFQAAMSKLAVGMAGVDDESSKAGHALAFLGISAKDPADALQQVADKLEEYADGVGKAAIARDLFGKNGPAYIDTLHKIAEAHEINATVTAADAQQAQMLNEQIALLGVQATTFKNILLQDVVPALNRWITGVEAARKSGLDWYDSLSIGTTYAERIVPRITLMQDQLKELKRQQDANAGQSPWFSQSVLENIDTTAKKLQVLIKLRDQMIMGNVAAMGFTGDARDLALTKPQLDYSSLAAAADAAAKAQAAFVAGLKDEVATYGLADVALKAYQASKLGVSALSAKYLVQLQQEGAAQAFNAAWVAKIDAGKKEYEDTLRATAKATDDATKSTQALVDGLVAQNATFGLGEFAMQRYELQQRLAIETAAGHEKAVRNIVAALEQLDALESKQTSADWARESTKAAQQSAAAFERAANQIEQSLESAVLDAFNTHGKSIAQDFAHWVEQLFAQMVLRPILQPVSSGIAGYLNPGGQQAASGLGINPFGSGGGTSVLSGLFSSFATSGVGGALGLGETVGASAAASAAGGLSLGVEAGATALTGGLSAAGTAIAAAIPVIGWIAAAGALIYSIVQANKTPSEVQGTFGISSGTGGFEDNQSAGSAFGNVGFTDAGTKQFSGQAAQGFDQVVTGLLDLFAKRETSGQISETASALQATDFGSKEGTYTTEDFLNKYGSDVLKKVAETAFDTLDPALSHVVELFEGDAAATATFVGGLVVLHDSLDKIPADIAEKLVGALDGTQAALDRANTFAVAYVSLQTLLNADPVADALDYLGQQSASLYDKLQDQVDATEALIAASDGGSQSLVDMANAAQGTYNALVQAIAQAEQFKSSIAAMFGDTIRSLTLQTLSDQGKYNYYQNDADTLRGQLLNAKDPAVIQALTKQINDDLNAAFGLLSPDEQKAHLQEYIDHITEINAQAQGQLDTATGGLQDELSTLLTDMRDKFNDVADKLGAAADTSQAAADTSLEAAKTPIEVDVTIRQPTSEVNSG